MTAQVRFIDSPIAFGRKLIRCDACGDDLHPDDFRPDMYPDAFVAAVRERFGPSVCFGCMDNIDKEGMHE